MPTALYAQLAARHARMGEYRAMETALEFAGADAEFAAMTGDCTVTGMDWRTKFRVSGNDRARWLNGMVTNNVRELPQDEGNYNFVLNAQGRIQGDLYVYNRGEFFLADTDASQMPALLALLDRYIIMDEVELADATAEFTAIAVRGPRAEAVLADAGAKELPAPLQVKQVTLAGATLLCARPASFATYELWMDPAMAANIWESLVAAGAVPAGAEAWEMFRIASGTPLYGVDIRDRDLPQETGQTSALSASKGCYIGQEIMERIRSRGAVHRVLAGFVASGPLPAPGAKLECSGKEVGELTSVRSFAATTLALGYIRREFSQPGLVVTAGDSQLTVSKPPFPQIFPSE